jgi:N-acetylmuramate 1-kinase
MPALPSSPTSQAIELPNEDATRRLAVDIAAMLMPGDVVTLTGDLGAGKTTFARALIRHLAGEAIDVPSPTFTLMQVYDLPRFSVVHADFYRLTTPSEVIEIGFADASDGAVALIEWPEKAADLLPADRLDVALALDPARGSGFRDARIAGHGTFATRVEWMSAMRRFLDQTEFAAADRRHLQGDASTRAYERLELGDRRAVLMNAPRRQDGPPVRDSRPYSAIAHLAEDVKPFVAMARALRERGLSAPAIYASDLDAGLLILEDLGSEGVVAESGPIAERYAAAVDVLVELHRQVLPDVLPVGPDIAHRLPVYDLDALLIEAELLLDWYLPHRGGAIDAEARAEFVETWTASLQPAPTSPPTWVLRDYHSPNLLWLPQREGVARVGILDFQDAMMGPAAYDVVSLLQDARVDVPEAMEMTLLGRYVKARRAADPGFDAEAFVALYAALGAQRATKILGIFARLNRRDGKPQYLRHLPRVWRNLTRALSHPLLGPLRTWYQRHVPEP